MQEMDCKESSNCSWARYDESTKLFSIDFKNKAGAKSSTYEYANVPPEMWAQFNAATSKGAFFAAHIRPKFKGVKTWPSPKAEASDG